MTDRKPQDQDKFIIRLPDGMRDRIKAAADYNRRSMNAEIVATLEEAYPNRVPVGAQLETVALAFEQYPESKELAEVAAQLRAIRKNGRGKISDDDLHDLVSYGMTLLTHHIYKLAVEKSDKP